ncbi:mucin-7-like [Clinocottus analis]|uniref:mucin-7-like n=1 Tax=Clinocottus analis TaxID=304258 RepID=UPI0035C01B6D
MMCPVKSRNGNSPRARKQSRWEELRSVCCCDLRAKAAKEKRFEMNLAFCVLVVLTGSSQTRGQSSASPPAHTLSVFPSSASPDLREDPGNGVSQRTHSEDEPFTETTTTTEAKATIPSEAATEAVHMTHSAVATPEHTVMTAPSPAAARDHLSPAPPVRSSAPPPHAATADGRADVTADPFSASSSLPAHRVQDTSATAHASTVQPQSESWTTTSTHTTTGRPLISGPSRGPAGPTYQEVPSELNVGDEDLKGPRYRSSSPLDPLLAGLLSVFIVTTAIVFVILFLKFRQRTNHPEFHRLQDLPMDDLMEDTPLSRYTY